MALKFAKTLPCLDRTPERYSWRRSSRLGRGKSAIAGHACTVLLNTFYFDGFDGITLIMSWSRTVLSTESIDEK